VEKLYKVSFYFEDGQNNAEEELKGIFEGKYGELYKQAGKEYHTIYAGLGKHEELKNDKLKCLCGKLAKELNSLKAKNCSVEVGHLTDLVGKKVIMPIVEGFLLGGYNFEAYKTKKENNSLNLSLTIDGKEESGECAEIFEKVKELFAGTKAEDYALDEEQCEELGMHTFLRVGLSSANMPRLVVIKFMNDSGNKEILGYIGKGLTYDTGGYSLKSSMIGMKMDMAGAAAVTGAMHSLVKNDVKTNVIAVMPCCENRLSDSSCVPGDVLNTMNGKTIEVTNTDAEGRLVLADAITYAIRKENVTKLVDIATLTGAMARALGGHRAGMFTNDEDFLKDFKKAAKKCGEKYWQFPMDDVYRKLIKSDIADMKNSGEPAAGAIFAACFLEEFVEGKPWIHMDIAGTAYKEKPVFDYNAKGATGFGAETLYCLAARG